LPVPPAIHSVASAHMNAQLRHALTHRLCVAQIARFNLVESGSNTDLGSLVTKAAEPIGIWFAPILALVTDEFDHKNKCSIKATNAPGNQGIELYAALAFAAAMIS